MCVLVSCSHHIQSFVTHASGLTFTIQVNELQPPEASAIDPEILDSHPISMIQRCGHFISHPGRSVDHGNQQEMTEDKWMLTNLMCDSNNPNDSDFMV